MAQSIPGPQSVPGRRNRLALALGAGQLLLAAPMLATIATAGLVVAVMGTAAGGPAVAVVLLALLLAAGPLLGLGLAYLAARLRGLSGDVAFPVVAFGLLLGTTVEYVAWIGPALG
ncbi:hypothetical protein ACFQ6N_35600 [Kitasatospora sp. NPDC056446]|uniref:hypothetical protein n=1 Tax=Kitasatospora sp. NPDC056446 TaxID=3345819 RepID=UPI0036971B64